MVDKKSHKTNSGNQPATPIDTSSDSAEPVVWANKKKLLPTKWTVITIAAVLLVVAASALYIFKTANEEVPTVEIDVDQVATTAHNLEEEGKYKQAIAAYDVAVENTEGEEKAALISAQALIAQRAEDLDLALDYALQADNAESTVETQSLVGAIAKQKGDTKLAIEYYEKALLSYKGLEIRDEPEEQAIQSLLNKLREGEQ